MSFAAWIREARESRRLSKIECARRAGITHPAWIEYENTSKTAQPRRETVEKIALALEVPISEAMAAAGYGQDPAINERLAHRLEVILRPVSPEKRARIEDAIEQNARSLVAVAG